MADATTSGGTATNSTPSSNSTTNAQNGGTSNESNTTNTQNAGNSSSAAPTSSGGTASSGSTQQGASNQGGTVTSGGTTSAGSQSSTSGSAGSNNANSGNNSSDSSSQQSGGPKGYTVDSSNTLNVNVGVPFSYKLNTPLTTGAGATGYMPEGIHLDVANSVIVGTPKLATGTVLTIFNPGQKNVTVPVKVNAELDVSVVGYAPITSQDGAFYNRVALPAYRGQGDSPALSIVGFGGTGTYSYSITGDSQGLSIDSKSGALSGSLPKKDGQISVTVSVTDGIATKTIDVSFYVSDVIPVVAQTSEVEWWDGLDAYLTNLKNDISAAGDTTTPDQWMALYNRFRTPFLTFINDIEYRAVPAIQTYVTGAIALEKSAPAQLKSLISNEDRGILLTLNALLNQNGSFELGANMTNVAKVVARWQSDNGQGVSTL